MAERRGSESAQAVPVATPRLEFRLWSADDWPLATALWGDARITELIGGPLDERRIRERLETELSQQQLYGVQYWALFHKETAAHAGCCGLRPRDPERQIFELGFRLRPEYWGKGLATEAARAVLKHAFDVIGARGIFAGHHPDNSASKHVLEKLGLRYTHHELYAPTGLQHPSYFLTVDEYRETSMD
jgi:RimJ/RimL family protein N-acetyltransferase